MTASLTVLTGASSNHFGPLLNLLATVDVYAPGTRVVVHDLGLTAAERVRLGGRDVRVFDFDAHPEFMDLRRHPRPGPGDRLDHPAGLYAWKPLIVRDGAREFGGLVLWVDAGDRLTGPLEGLPESVGRWGGVLPFDRRHGRPVDVPGDPRRHGVRPYPPRLADAGRRPRRV